VGEVAVAFQPNLEQLLVLLPQGIAEIQGTAVANRNTKRTTQGCT
jgi:phospholipid/cholesterol/gamma-HCH transport system substrate-binding protein